MKIVRRHCKKCKKETLHDEGYRESTGGMIFGAVFTLGFSLAGEEKDRTCQVCGKSVQIAGMGT